MGAYDWADRCLCGGMTFCIVFGFAAVFCLPLFITGTVLVSLYGMEGDTTGSYAGKSILTLALVLIFCGLIAVIYMCRKGPKLLKTTPGSRKRKQQKNQQQYERFESESPAPKTSLDTTPPPSYEESSGHAQYYPAMSNPQPGSYQKDNNTQHQQYQQPQPMSWPPTQPCPSYADIQEQRNHGEKRPLGASSHQAQDMTSNTSFVRQYPTAPAFGNVQLRAAATAPSAPTLPAYSGLPPKC